jgi:hypothetical protein
MAPSAIPLISPSASPLPSKTLTTTKDTQPSESRNDLTPLQAISQGVCLPSIPTFVSFSTHRAWLLAHMAGAFRVFARKGFTEGLSGHISVRDPEFHDRFWTNPLGRHFGLLKASDMICVDYEGKVCIVFL